MPIGFIPPQQYRPSLDPRLIAALQGMGQQGPQQASGPSDLASAAIEKVKPAAVGGAGGVAASGSSAATTGASAFPVATDAATGGTLMSDGSVVAATDISNFAGSATPFLGAAGVAAGAYNALRGIKKKDPIRSALGGAGVGLGLNMMEVGLGPAGWAVAAGAPAAIALGRKLLDRKTTKEYQRERWGKLGSSSDKSVSDYANNYLNYLKSDQAKTDAKYENTFEGKKKAGTLKAEDVWGGLGIIEEFGPEYLTKRSEDERRKIAQTLIDRDLLYTSKGDIKLKDKDAARKAYEESIGSGGATMNKPPPITPVLRGQIGSAPTVFTQEFVQHPISKYLR